MKRLQYSICVCTALLSCTNQTQKTFKEASTAAYVVADFTDHQYFRPEPTFVLNQYHFDSDPSGEAWFQLTSISDKTINGTYTCHLANKAITDQQNRDADPQGRAKSVLQFYASVKSCYRNFYVDHDTTKTIAASYCWETVCSALRELTTLPAAHKFLIVYSDLSENSSLINVYRKSMLNDTAAITRKLSQSGLLSPDLKGIQVVVRYVPQSTADDYRFSRMFSVYKNILESKGAVVTLNTSMNTGNK